MVEARLAYYLNCDVQQVLDTALEAPNSYHTFFIKKSNGKLRQITAPNDALKKLQAATAVCVFLTYPVSKYCKGFETRDSIKKNALSHIKSRHMLTLDIQDFFPSVTRRHFDALLEGRYSQFDRDLLWQICSYKNRLTVGSPASPLIANRVMAVADTKIAKAAKKCTYTRYADDLTFSSKKHIPPELVDRVAKALYEFGFYLNMRKLRFGGSGSRRRVTGINLCGEDNKLSVGCEYKKSLRHCIHRFLVKSIGNAQVLKGRLQYLKTIEPSTYEAYARKYAALDSKQKLFKPSKLLM